MSTLTVSKTYSDGVVLSESDLDAVKSDLESYYNSTRIDGNNLQQGSINGASILANSAVTTSKIADSMISSEKMQDGVSSTTGITAAKIIDNELDTDKFNTASVTTAKIANEAITTPLITNNSVPKAIMPLPYFSTTSVISGVGSGTRISVPVTDLVAGKPVILTFESGTTTESSGYIKAQFVSFLRDGNNIGTCTNLSSVGEEREFNGSSFYVPTVVMGIPPSSYMLIDTPTSTSHTYSVTTSDANADFSGTVFKIMQVI